MFCPNFCMCIPLHSSACLNPLCAICICPLLRACWLSLICWFKGLSMKDKNSLNNIAKVCPKIIGAQQRDPSVVWEEHVVKKAKSVFDQQGHVLSSDFILLLSGQHYSAPLRKTNHYSKYFIPSAIHLLNAQWLSYFFVFLSFLKSGRGSKPQHSRTHLRWVNSGENLALNMSLSMCCPDSQVFKFL